MSDRNGCSGAVASCERLQHGYSRGVKFRVIIEPDEDGLFVAECPALPGCISQGKTRDEAMANIRDAVQGYLESLKKHGERRFSTKRSRSGSRGRFCFAERDLVTSIRHQLVR